MSSIYNTSSRLDKGKNRALPVRRAGVGPGGGPMRAGGGIQQRQMAEALRQQQLKQQQDPLTFNEFQLSSTSKNGRQNHLMDFKQAKKVEPKEFARPVKLHRKESNFIPYRQYIANLNQQNAANAAAAAVQKAKSEAIMAGKPVPEDVKMEEFGETSTPKVMMTTTVNGKDQHGPKTGADTSLIAPLGGATRNKNMLFKKRTKQIFMAKEDTRELKEQEHRPWILEDYDSQNSYTGTLEGGQRSDYMFFVLTNDGFKVVPVDRWYKFQAKRNFKTLSSEEVEEHYKKQQKKENGRWMMLNRNGTTAGTDQLEGHTEGSRPSKFKLVDRDDDHVKADDDDEGRGGKNRHDSDIDDLDFDDVFQDDDEGVAEHEVEDEDVKDSKDRVKKEIKDFAIGGGGNGQFDIEEELFEDSIKLTSEGKAMRKIVRELGGEKNHAYESDEEGDPYASSADEEDSDTEKKEGQVEELGEEKDQAIKKSSIMPPKKKPVTASSSKHVIPKKGLASKLKKESMSKPIGRPGSPSIYMQKKAQREQQQRDGSLSPTNGVTQRPASPPTTTTNYKAPSSPVSSSSSTLKQHRPSPVPSSPPSHHHHHKEHSKKRKNENDVMETKRPKVDDLITQKEVIDTLRGKTMTTKEFLMSFKRRIKNNDQNRGIITEVLKKVAKRNTSGDRLLELKPEYQ